MHEFLKKNDKVIVLSLDAASIGVPDIKTEVINLVGANNVFFVENVDNFLKHNWNPSSIDVILTGCEQISVWNDAVLKKCFEVLKPKGTIVLCVSINEVITTKTDYISKLRLNGFLSDTSQTVSTKVSNHLEKILFKKVAEKPTYEIGSSMKLSFAKTSNNLWKFKNYDDLIDEGDLLDENDETKPAEFSLQVCSTTGKRKACKDCSCGLKDELNDKTSEQRDKSSCGNCYLGDAFRCGNCPYLGMAAFKPGEKIILEDSQLLNL